MNRQSRAFTLLTIRPHTHTLQRARRALVVALFFTILAALSLIIGSNPPDASKPNAATSRPSSPRPTIAQVREAYARLPLSFEANRGQADESVDFVARGAGYTLALSPTSAVFGLQNSGCGLRDDDATPRTLKTGDGARAESNPQSAKCNPTAAVLRMNLVGANHSAGVAGLNELEGKVNYLTGNDPAQWRTNIPTFERVRYDAVYPGIDVVYYGNQRQLEYDFVVAAGSDARAVRLEFEGAEKVEVEASGDLLLKLGESVVRQPKPFVYQEVAGARRAVEGGYVVESDGRVGFALGVYDAALPLIIDPVLVYSTYIGGSGTDVGNEIGVDSAGNAYICGSTSSTNFPVVNALQGTFGGATFEGGRDGFVTKLNAAGTAFVYSTYLGGSGDDRGNAIEVDASGNAYVVGETTSTNFPTANAFQPTFGGGLSDAFVTKLNSTGSALVYSTFVGGAIFDAGNAIALDSSGSVYISGRTTSEDFPTVNPIQSTYSGGPFADTYISKINAAGSALVYSTYLGGNDFEAGSSIAVDSSGNAYLTGQTRSTNYPTANAIQSTFGGGDLEGDAFLTKVNAAGTAFVYSTYLGGALNDVGFEVVVDSAGSAHVVGTTASNNFPVANAFQSALSGTSDGFVTKLNAAGTAFAYSTYLGGTSDDSVNGIAIGANGNAYVSGGTSSTDFPTVNPTQGTNGGGIDAFVAQFNATGSALLYSTYLGGSGSDVALSIAVDSDGSMYLTGRTTSTNFVTLSPAQGTNGGGQDGFITKISDPPTPTPTPTATPTPTPTPVASTVQFAQASYTVQEDITFVTVAVTRTGDVTGAATIDFETSSGTANERSDYTTALGTLRFAAGETSQTFDLLISEDSYTEGTEAFTVVLSNPTGGASPGSPSIATVQITDDAAEPATNAIDDASTFVGQHYHDFLNRQHDIPGLAFWTNEITLCGADAACTDFKRISVSGAYFVSIEFQGTGFKVIRIYKSTFDDSTARPRGLPRYREFLRDMREIQRGVVVGVGNWEQQLQANMLDFARAWVQKPEVLAALPADLSAEQFVDRLFQNVEVTPAPAERDAARAAFGAGGTEGRARALLSVIDSGAAFNKQFNCAFVLMQYFGYLRRNPDDSPDTSFAGFDFWLSKLDSFTPPGEDVRDELTARRRIFRAEMVRAFLISGEYRRRFGQQ